MKNKKKLLLVLTLAFCFAFAMLLPDVDFYFTQVNYAQAAGLDAYYSSVTATSGKELSGQLHDLIVSTHTTYSSYNDCHYKASKTDPGKGSNTVLEFYTHTDIAFDKWDVSGGWNREHVWPKSDSNGLWGTSGGGSDLHHVRPAEKDLNNHRGSKLYGEAPNGVPEYTSVTKYLGGHSSGNVFEPLDMAKGDVARIVMYVYLHYNKTSTVGGSVESKMTAGNLPITNIISAGGTENAWKLLLKWNKLDPVDDIERLRNDEVYKIQGNRNPFIDNESYADAIWGDGTVEKTELKSLAMNVNSLNLAVGGTSALSVTPTPSNANSQVTWSSGNTSVATVNANGLVTALAEGSTIITATSKENPSITATATVTVKSVRDIEISGTPTQTEYNVGDRFNPAGLTVKVLYSDGTDAIVQNGNFQWLDAATGKELLRESTTKIKCKYGNIEKELAFTVKVTVVDSIQNLIKAVDSVDSATSLESKFAAIESALRIYNQLSESEKQQAAAVYKTLLDKINEYNSAVGDYNDGFESATRFAAETVAKTALALLALIVILKQTAR